SSPGGGQRRCSSLPPWIPARLDAGRRGAGRFSRGLHAAHRGGRPGHAGRHRRGERRRALRSDPSRGATPGRSATPAPGHRGRGGGHHGGSLQAQPSHRRHGLLRRGVNPNYRAVLETNGAGSGYRFDTAEAPSGVTDLPDLSGAACLVLAQPNFFGWLEDVGAAARAAHDAGALLVVAYDPTSAGILEAPGVLGADVATGEGQGLGNALSYGGPYLGIFAT